MYTEYFGFQQKPFTYTSDPDLLFMSRGHQEVLDSLQYGIRNRVGFLAVTGEIGAGKTTLCRYLLKNLPSSITTAYIFNTSLTEIQFLQTFLTDLGLAVEKKTRHALFSDLNRFLIQELKATRNVVLIIDEAQNLSLKLMEQIRMLSNLETDKEKLLQIVLVGQPELAEKLNHSSLKQLRQRIVIRTHVGALAPDEIGEYILMRVKGAELKTAPQFSDDAIHAIYEYSSGIPRLINMICDKCLLATYAAQKYRIDLSIVQRAIKDTEGMLV